MIADSSTIVNPPSGKVHNAPALPDDPSQPCPPGVSSGSLRAFLRLYSFFLVFLAFFSVFVADVTFFITVLFSLEALTAPGVPPAQPLEAACAVAATDAPATRLAIPRHATKLLI